MSNIYRLIIFLPLFMIGCAPNIIDENKVKQIIYNVLESTRIIGLLLIPLLPELSTKINDQLGSIYREEIPWKKQLVWGLLVSNSSLPKPTPIINKLEYEQHL